MALLPLSQRDIRQQSWLINGSSLLKKHTDWFDSETFRSLLLQALSLSLTHFEHFEVCSLCTCGCGMKQNVEVTFVYKSHCHMLDESTKRQMWKYHQTSGIKLLLLTHTSQGSDDSLTHTVSTPLL